MNINDKRGQITVKDVFDKLSNELSSFNETLMDKPTLVVRTKRDTMDKAKNLENWKNFSEEYIDISSSQIRDAIHSDKNLTQFVPEVIADYISLNQLYR